MLRIGDKVELVEGLSELERETWKAFFKESEVVVKKYNPEQTMFFIGLEDSDIEVEIRGEKIKAVE